MSRVWPCSPLIHLLPCAASSRNSLTSDRWVSSAEIADDYSTRAQRIASGWPRDMEPVEYGALHARQRFLRLGIPWHPCRLRALTSAQCAVRMLADRLKPRIASHRAGSRSWRPGSREPVRPCRRPGEFPAAVRAGSPLHKSRAKIPLDRADGGLPDDVAQAHQLLVDRRQHVRALRLEGRQVRLPSHEVEVGKRDGELLLISACRARPQQRGWHPAGPVGADGRWKSGRNGLIRMPSTRGVRRVPDTGA